MFPLMPPIPEEVNPAPAWVAAEATYTVSLDAEREEAHLTMRYRFDPLNRGWYMATLSGPQLVADRVSGPVSADARGLYVIIGPGTAPVMVTIEGTVPAPGGSLQLPILPALRQRVEVEAPGLEVEMPGVVDHHLSQSSLLMMQFVPARTGPPPRQPPLTKTKAAHAFYEEGGELLVHSRLQFDVVRGEEDEFRFSAAGLSDIQVVGEGLAKWERRGSEIVLTPRAPVKGSFVVEVDGQAALPAGSFVVPVPVPTGAVGGERYYALGVSEEAEMVPERGRTIAARSAPLWARGLMERQAVVWWQGDIPTLRTERYQPQLGPDTVIERAEMLVVASEDGTTLLRSTFYVRNERRQYLHLIPSPGFEVVTARRGSRAIPVLSDGKGGIYIAMERSVETVRGPVAMPVEVSWIGKLAAFDERKGSYQLEVPAVDAPIQAVQWEIHLPRGYIPGKKEGENEGGPVYQPAREQAQDALYNAMDAWRDNDVEQARYWTDRAAQLAPDDENAARLDANIDLLLGNTFTSSNNAQDDANARRIRSIQAAKNEALEDAQAVAEKKAAEALAIGDLDEAERQYGQVLTAAEIIQRTEQSGAEEQRARWSSASSGLAEVRNKKEESKKASQPVIATDPSPAYGRGEAQATSMPATVTIGDGTFELDSLLGGETGEISGGFGISGQGVGGGGSAEGIGGLGVMGVLSGASAGDVFQPDMGAVFDNDGDAVVDDMDTMILDGMMTEDLLEEEPTLSFKQDEPVRISDQSILLNDPAALGYIDNGTVTGANSVTVTGGGSVEPVIGGMKGGAMGGRGDATRALQSLPAAAAPKPSARPAPTMAPPPAPVTASPPPPPPPPPPSSRVTVGSGSSAGPVYKATTEIDFEGADVNGELAPPPGAFDRKAADMSIIDMDGTPAPEEQPIALDDLGYLEDMEVPAEPLPEPEISEGRALNQEYLARVPAGRSYQSVSQSVPGVVRGGKGGAKSAKSNEEADEKEDSYEGEEDERAPGKGKQKDSPYADVPDTTSDSGYDDSGRAQPAQRAQDSRDAKPSDKAANNRATTRTRAPEIPSPVEGRTVEFAQKPTPFTLALPLDGVALYRSASLLESYQTPVITFTYRSTNPRGAR